MNIGQPKWETEEINPPTSLTFMRLKKLDVKFDNLTVNIYDENAQSYNRSISFSGLRIRFTIKIKSRSNWPLYSPVQCAVSLKKQGILTEVRYQIMQNGKGQYLNYGNVSNNVVDYATITTNSKGFVMDYQIPVYAQTNVTSQFTGNIAGVNIQTKLPVITIFVPDGSGDSNTISNGIECSTDIGVDGQWYSAVDRVRGNVGVYSMYNRTDPARLITVAGFRTMVTDSNWDLSKSTYFKGFTCFSDSAIIKGLEEINNIPDPLIGNSLSHSNHSGVENGIEYYSTEPSSKVLEKDKKKTSHRILSFLNKLIKRNKNENN